MGHHHLNIIAAAQHGGASTPALARNEHLTTMFLSRDCKLDDVQR